METARQEKYMPPTEFKPEFLNEVRQKLLAEKARLEEELASFAHKNPRNPDDFETNFPQFGSDEDENASEVTAFADNLTAEGELENQLRDIKKALQRIENGTYGICNLCSQAIEEARLRARPESGSHVRCKETVKGEYRPMV